VYQVAVLLGLVILAFPAAVRAQIDHSGGFASNSDLKANASATFVGGAAQLTHSFFEAGSFFAIQKQCITSFTTTFDFQQTPVDGVPSADGITFTAQNDPSGDMALGGDGGALGYLFGITKSVAVGLDYGFNNFGEGLNSTDLLFNGGLTGAVFVPPGPINLQDTHKKTITLAYDSSTKVLLETIKDDTTNLTFSHTYNSVDIPGNVGGSTAFVGFTGGTGGLTAVQDILTWTLKNPPPTISNVSVSPSTLWPPNQKLVDVTVSYGSSDPCSAPICKLSVTSNEPGDGTEAVVVDAHHVQLKADRNGNGDGRIYTITITCTDAAGNVASSTVTVTVAHDQGKG
jgi:hypothetical protein